MCLLGIGFRVYDGCPLVLMANREESYSRRSAGPQVRRQGAGLPNWLGGMDVAAGGTWLGVNSSALVVAVTNRRRAEPPVAARSRGLLCRDLLTFTDLPSAVDFAMDQLRHEGYAGCNLLVANREAAAVIEFGDDLRVTRLPPGLHLLANGPLNDAADRRLERVREELEQRPAETPAAWIDQAATICSLGAAPGEPAVCLTGPDRGTVSSTLLALFDDPTQSIYRHAPGPPARVAYEDYSASMQRLLASPERHRLVHRIALRGPWRLGPTTLSAVAVAGEPFTAEVARASSETMRLPATWSDLPDRGSRQVRLTRRFHRPTNLAAQERVSVVVEQASGRGRAWCNGVDIGSLGPLRPTLSADVTDCLEEANELCIELERPEDAATVPLWQSVALEIHAVSGD